MQRQLVSRLLEDGAEGRPLGPKQPLQGAFAHLEALAGRLGRGPTARQALEQGGADLVAHWVRSNLVKHMAPTWVQNCLMRPFGGVMGLMGPEEGAQTQLHCLLDDNAPKHTGEYFSQNAIFYANPEDKKGGWPMRSPNPLVYDDALADRLFEVSKELIGLAKS